MDPITQGALGAALPQATATSRRGAVAVAGCFGFLAGMAADLDVLIRSSQDPLLFLEYHRQFSHALVFIPIGGLIAAAVLHLLAGRWLRLPFGRSFLFCTLGYGTHGLLDFATSYGTVLFWPFSQERYAANIISIVDPLFTVPVVCLIVLAGVKRRPLYARLALAWVIIYLSLATLQHFKAREMAQRLAAERGHEIQRLTVKPTFGNILLWKSVYESEDRFYLDGLRVGIAPLVHPGSSVARLDPARDFPWLAPESQQYRDLMRFDRFSQGYSVRNPEAPESVIDARYSFLPNETDALWSIELTPDAGPDQHVEFHTDRESARSDLGRLWAMIRAQAPP